MLTHFFPQWDGKLVGEDKLDVAWERVVTLSHSGSFQNSQGYLFPNSPVRTLW